MVAKHIDFNWVGSVDTRKSKTSYGVHSWFMKVISWKSKLQPTIALSSIDIKYKVNFSIGCEAMWL